MGENWGKRVIWLTLALMFCTGCGPAEAPVSGEAQLPEEKLVALTFDDGPRRQTTEALLDGLKERGVPATFFLIGEQVAGQEDLLQRMAEEGHQIGNHTWSHARLPDSAADQVLEEIRRGDRMLRQTLGEGDYWLRPPYGLLEAMEGLETPIVRWSVDPRDWESRDADQVTEHVLSHVQPGDIVLLHDIYPSSVEAALRIIDALQKEGYRFVTVRQLLEAYGVEPQPGVSYRKGPQV